ncbi:MAG: hypothetical protein BGO32_10410 [Bacteroidetes bacterium 37-13]|nr:MAG: hypothetical protein BGO32_10410 [Bacteroidetes bacterium 37-13]
MSFLNWATSSYLTKFSNAKLRLLSLVVTLTLFAISYLTVGWWTDAYQHMYDTGISGELTNYDLAAAHNPFPEYMPGGAWVFNRLGALYPIRWVAFFLNGVLFISIWVIYYNTLKHVKQYPLLSVILILLFLSILFVESVLLYHMVRITMFAGIAALSYFLVHDEKRWLSLRAVPYFLLFVVALWIRCNVHLFLLTFLTGAFLLHRKSIKPLVVFWLAFTLFFLFYCKVVFWTDYSNDLNAFFLYNTEFKLQHTGDFEKKLHIENALDSVKYEAIANEIFADEENLPPSFYYKIGILDHINKFSLTQAIYAYYIFKRTVLENLHFVAMDLVLILFYLVFGGAKTRHFRINTFLLFLFFYGIVAALSFIKMENRFLVPFQVFFLLTILIMHRPAVFSEKKYIPLLAIFVLVSAILSFHFISQKVLFAKSFTSSTKKAYEWLHKNYPDATVVINDRFITYNRPYETFYQQKEFKHFYIFNYYALHLSPSSKKYYEKMCSCSVKNHVGFYDFLLSENKTVLILDRPKRAQVLSKYLRMVYSQEYTFTPVSSQNVNFNLAGFGEDFGLFTLGKEKK